MGPPDVQRPLGQSSPDELVDQGGPSCPPDYRSRASQMQSAINYSKDLPAAESAPRAIPSVLKPHVGGGITKHKRDRKSESVNTQLSEKLRDVVEKPDSKSAQCAQQQLVKAFSPDGVETHDLASSANEASPKTTAEETVGKPLEGWPSNADSRGSPDKIPDHIMAKLDKCGTSHPRYMLRVVTKGDRRGLRTKGLSSMTHYAPAAVVNHIGKEVVQEAQGHLRDIPYHRLQLMAPLHALWADRRNDCMLSWSITPAFVFQHALGREARGETGATFSIVDTWKAVDKEGQPVKFYYLPRVLEILKSADVTWSSEGMTWHQGRKTRLLGHEYDHEYVTIGEFYYPADSFRQVSLSEFRDQGLFKLFPIFSCKKRLYRSLVDYREVWFENCQPMTSESLHLALNITKLFVNSSATDSAAEDAPIAFFLMLVSMNRRRLDASEVQDLAAFVRANFHSFHKMDAFLNGDSEAPSRIYESVQYRKLVKLLQPLIASDGSTDGDEKALCARVRKRVHAEKTTDSTMRSEPSVERIVGAKLENWEICVDPRCKSKHRRPGPSFDWRKSKYWPKSEYRRPGPKCYHY
ncbi:hypothetical protein LTR66_004848 [Elasticomyces elasticus]|nr:hypothetical protein LTR66_004848 [Elasticomyces elasticus]